MATRSRARLIAYRAHVALSALFAWCGIAGNVHVARAEAELVLSWPSMPACPEASWVEQRIRERLGRPLDDRAFRSLEASAAILTKEHGWTLILHLRQDDRDGTREMSASNCVDLGEAAALVVALAIDPNAAAQAQTQPPDAPSNDAAPRPSDDASNDEEPARPQPSPKPKPATPNPRPVRAYVGLMLDVGSLPSSSVGPVAAIGYQWRRYRAELAGTWLPPRASSGEVGRVTVSMWAIAPTGCAELFGRTMLVLSTCASFELGRSVGKGRQLQQSVQAGSLHAAGTLGLRLLVPVVANAALVGESAALVPFLRTRFVSVDTNEQEPAPLHESAKLALRARLAMELRF